jgi:hypothetical protein
MVWLSGPRKGRLRGNQPDLIRQRGIYLHDAPPGYRPPKMQAKDRRRMARQDWVLMRVTTVVLVLAAAAFMVIIFVLIATHI